MYDFTNTPLPFTTRDRDRDGDRDGDGDELVITIHAIANNRLICSVTGRSRGTFATDYPVTNDCLTPPTPSKIDRIIAAKAKWGPLYLAKLTVEGLILAQAVLENQTPAQIRALALTMRPAQHLKDVDRHVTA